MRLKLKENPSEWRNFTLICCAFTLGLTLFASWRGWLGDFARVGICAVITAAGLIAIWNPRTFRPFYRGAMRISFTIGQVMGKVILGSVYLLVVTPLGLLLRLTGKDLLHLKERSRRDSYWKEARPPGKLDQQF